MPAVENRVLATLACAPPCCRRNGYAAQGRPAASPGYDSNGYVIPVRAAPIVAGCGSTRPTAVEATAFVRGEQHLASVQCRALFAPVLTRMVHFMGSGVQWWQRPAHLCWQGDFVTMGGLCLFVIAERTCGGQGFCQVDPPATPQPLCQLDPLATPQPRELRGWGSRQKMRVRGVLVDECSWGAHLRSEGVAPGLGPGLCVPLPIECLLRGPAPGGQHRERFQGLDGEVPRSFCILAKAAGHLKRVDVLQELRPASFQCQVRSPASVHVYRSFLVVKCAVVAESVVVDVRVCFHRLPRLKFH